jgi:hypothetical protein
MRPGAMALALQFAEFMTFAVTQTRWSSLKAGAAHSTTDGLSPVGGHAPRFGENIWLQKRMLASILDILSFR